MFGYIKPFKPDLRFSEWDVYKSVYCGLCRELKKAFGVFAPLSLSYDFAFLSLLSLAINDKKPDFEIHRCYVNPLKKTAHCVSSDTLYFSSALQIIMLYYKLLDNIYDNGWKDKLVARIAIAFVQGHRKKAAKSFPELEEIICNMMEDQKKAEQDNSLDKACQPTAQALSKICSMLSDDAVEKKILERMGYFIGRYVYMIDAFDDMEEDEKNKNYNPFILSHTNPKEALYMNIGEIERAYNLLTLYRYEPILSNIINKGFQHTVNQIATKKENTK